MTTIARKTHDHPVLNAYAPPVPSADMPELTDEILAAIPQVYRAGLLNMEKDAGHLLSPARKAQAVADAISLLTRYGQGFADREISPDFLFAIRPKPRAPYDYAASRKLRFGDDVGAQLPVAVCATAGLCFRLNSGQITSMAPNGAYVEIEREVPRSKIRFALR